MHHLLLAVSRWPRPPRPTLLTLWSHLGRYARAYWIRVLSGDSGILPVVVGLILISIVFQTGNSHFLTAENLVNWLQQASLYMVMAMGIVVRAPFG